VQGSAGARRLLGTLCGTGHQPVRHSALILNELSKLQIVVRRGLFQAAYLAQPESRLTRFARVDAAVDARTESTDLRTLERSASSPKKPRAAAIREGAAFAQGFSCPGYRFDQCQLRSRERRLPSRRDVHGRARHYYSSNCMYRSSRGDTRMVVQKLSPSTSLRPVRTADFAVSVGRRCLAASISSRPSTASRSAHWTTTRASSQRGTCSSHTRLHGMTLPMIYRSFRSYRPKLPNPAAQNRTRRKIVQHSANPL
jgi:hypothetical protein